MGKNLQILPKMGKNELEQYADNFFGYGKWDAPCWVIGLEEKGAAKRDEFKRRFKAWKINAKSKYKDGLADLKDYHESIEIGPDVYNLTWRNLHRILSTAGFNVGQKISDLKCNWGGKYHRIIYTEPKLQDVALLEALPFPTQGGSSWPYKKWCQTYSFMETKKACAKKFLQKRLCRIADQTVKWKPKLVIVYGCGNISFRKKWEDLVKEKFKRQWKSYPKLKLKHFKQKQTLFVTMDHVANQFQKKDFPQRIGIKILNLRGIKRQA